MTHEPDRDATPRGEPPPFLAPDVAAAERRLLADRAFCKQILRSAGYPPEESVSGEQLAELRRDGAFVAALAHAARGDELPGPPRQRKLLPGAAPMSGAIADADVLTEDCHGLPEARSRHAKTLVVATGRAPRRAGRRAAGAVALALLGAGAVAWVLAARRPDAAAPPSGATAAFGPAARAGAPLASSGAPSPPPEAPAPEAPPPEPSTPVAAPSTGVRAAPSSRPPRPPPAPPAASAPPPSPPATAPIPGKDPPF